jgi:hypothetical protein
MTGETKEVSEMRYDNISNYSPINEVSPDKVDKLVESMLERGWVGCPILVYGESLITGSHRLAALHKIAHEHPEADVLNQEIAEDVTDIIEGRLAEFEAENGYIPEIEYDNIGWLFEGTWVENHKDSLPEW